MSYTIRNSDGTILLSLADNTVDRSATSLALVGKNIRSYGEYFNNNLVQLLSNSANTSSNPPRNPLKGQIWYDATIKKLKVYDAGFKPISGAIISGDQPTDLFTGDLWFDSTNNQLKLYSGNVVYLVGPVYPRDAGENGWVLPPVAIKDTSLIARKVVLLKAYGQFIGLASRTAFNLSAEDSLTYFNTSTTSTTVVSGLTILGDIKYTGQITNTYLSMSIDLDKSLVSAVAIPAISFNDQNLRIADFYLSRMFPIAKNVENNNVGLPLGTVARVLCTGGKNPNGLLSNDIQIRRFYVVDQPGIGISWQPYNYTNPGQDGSNVVYF